MKFNLTSNHLRVLLYTVFLTAAGASALAANYIILNFGNISTTQAFKAFPFLVSPKWEAYANDFIPFVHAIPGMVWPILVFIPLIFLIHFFAIGPKNFSEDGERILFYGAFTRFFHWINAILFSLIVITGLMIVFSKALGGGGLIQNARLIHLSCAYAFIVTVIPLFLVWLKDMIPMPHDVKWFLILGGYLSKKATTVPAGKFNAGQKIWFWLATVGGAVMFYTGFYLSDITSRPQSELFSLLKIHIILGLFILALFITHLYMSLFAVKGSLKSMISGFKGKEEVKCLHSKMKI